MTRLKGSATGTWPIGLKTGDRVSVKILNAMVSEDVEFSRRLAADTAATAALVSHPFVEQKSSIGVALRDRVYVVTE